MSAYAFQNPNSGFPMILQEDDRVVTVEVDDTYEPASADDLVDATIFTQAVSHVRDIDLAARILEGTFGADILS